MKARERIKSDLATYFQKNNVTDIEKAVEEALEAAGAREGDLILIGEEEFEFEPDRVSAES